MTDIPTIDFAGVKSRQQESWSSGDYGVVGTTLQITGEVLCETVDVSAGECVLDVAAGNGNASLAAARRGADVTATDYVPALLAQAEKRAAAEGLLLALRTADAEDLPFDAHSFDVVLSTFGVMFAPNQLQAAAELARVCRSGGRIGITAWTSTSFIGRMFKVVSSYVTPPAGVPSPLLWGDEERINSLFEAEACVVTQRLDFVFRYRSASHWLDTMRTYYGPIHKAFAALGSSAYQALEEELLDLADELNTSANGSLRVPSEYLQTVVIRS